MERQIGIGVIGMGWMGRVHSAAYRRLPEHFPDLGVRPRLLMAADTSPDRREHAERIGFERTTDDWHAVVDDPEIEVVNVTLPNVKLPTEMVDMMTAARAYEANLKSLQVFRNMTEQSLSLLKGS